jgi:hypothetical protein
MRSRRKIVANVERFGGSATFNEQDRLLTVDQNVKVAIRVARPASEGRTRAQRWRLVRSLSSDSDLTLVIRLDESKSNALDYYLVPTNRLAKSKEGQLRMANRVFTEQYRYSSLERFYRVCIHQV